MKKLLIFILLATSITACKNQKKDSTAQEMTQMERVMAVHDEMMPKMGTVGTYIGRLEAQIDSTAADSVRVRAIADLKAANRTMMGWMRDFGDAFTSEEILEGAQLTEAKKETLNTFEASVNEMKQEMNQALDNAAELLGETSGQ